MTWAWLDAYYGGPAVSPKDMAWDISDYKLENLGPDITAPEIDWDAIAALVAAKEEAAKETAESEELDSPPFPNKTTTVNTESQASVLATQLRELADKIESL